MNILVIAPHGMYNNYTGSFVHNQAKAYVQAGHKVRAVIPLAIGKRTNEGSRFSMPVKKVSVDGVEVCYVRHLSLGARGAKSFNARSSAWACKFLMRSILKGFQPDVIHAHTVHFGGTVAAVFQKRCKVPLVITTHGGDTNLAIEPEGKASAIALCNAADAVVAVSSTCLKKIDTLGLTTPTMRILNGFAAQNVQTQAKIPRRLIQVGTLSYQKRVELTVRAVALLKERYADVSLVIVGQGDQREKLESLCAQLGLTQNVRFTGQCANATVLEEMARSEIFIMPSVNEGFGIVYIEAMASGCVTIGTQGEGIADLIRHGENGYLVVPDSVDSIVETVAHCFENAEEASRVAMQGREDANDLTWENNAAQYVRLFEGLLVEKKVQQGTDQ